MTRIYLSQLQSKVGGFVMIVRSEISCVSCVVHAARFPAVMHAIRQQFPGAEVSMDEREFQMIIAAMDPLFHAECSALLNEYARQHSENWSIR